MEGWRGGGVDGVMSGLLSWATVALRHTQLHLGVCSYADPGATLEIEAIYCHLSRVECTKIMKLKVDFTMTSHCWELDPHHHAQYNRLLLMINDARTLKNSHTSCWC